MQCKQWTRIKRAFVNVSVFFQCVGTMGNLFHQKPIQLSLWSTYLLIHMPHHTYYNKVNDYIHALHTQSLNIYLFSMYANIIIIYSYIYIYPHYIILLYYIIIMRMPWIKLFALIKDKCRRHHTSTFGIILHIIIIVITSITYGHEAWAYTGKEAAKDQKFLANEHISIRKTFIYIKYIYIYILFRVIVDK